MGDESNRKITLRARPEGYPKLSDFGLVEEPIPQPREGEVLVKSIWLSLDPYMRGRMREGGTFAASVGLGETMVGSAVGRIVESRTPAYEVGEIVAELWLPQKKRTPRPFREQGERFAMAFGLLGLDGNAQTQDAMVATCAGVASLMGFALEIPGN